KIVVTTEKPNNSYPASNLFDGNLNSQFHCNQSGDYCDIFFKLDKPYLMDRLRLVSYRSNTSGLINEFKVLLKEMNTNQKWVELGEYKVESYQNKWLEVKGKPYLTDEICLRIEDSVNGWTLINELELFIHSDLEREIRDLFLDENCNILKDSVTYNEILVLENRVLITEEYRTLILRAKELYLDKQPDLNFILETDKKIVMNQIKVQTSGKVYKTEVVYNDEHNNEIRLQAKEIETREEEVVLTFPNFYCDRFNLMLDGDISEELIQNIKITQLNQNNFFEDKDIDVRLDKSQLTAVSNCGQFEDNSPDKVLDGNNETYFHSLTYSGSYGDFVIKLEQEYVVDRLRFITRGDNEGQGNGRIRAYEVLYKNSGSTEWKKVFEELSDQSGNDREAVFKAVLASEICIRVTNGKNKYVVIKELDIFKYNYIDEKISNLFTDKTETEIKASTTLEDIEILEREIKTESYLLRVKKAKELYILTLPQNEFEIPLEEQKILDRVQFITSERVLRACIKYIDVYGVERLIQSEFEALGNIYTLNIRKIMTSSATLIVYGVSSIGNIFSNNYEKSEFYIDEDIDSRVGSDKIQLSATNVHASYPLSNLFDNDLNTQYRALHYVEHEDIYLKLDKEYLIDRLRLVSFRSPISGLVKTFKVLAKEMNTGEWCELGENSVTSHQNTWREVKAEPYLTDEICVRVVDSEDKWTIINELELFIYNKLEKQIDELFTDSTFESLKDEVTYQQILDLEARVLITAEYKEKVQTAKALYLAKTVPLHFTLEIDRKNVMNALKVSTVGKIYYAEISYTDAYGYNKIANILDIENKGLETILTFEHFYSDRFNLTVRGDVIESEIKDIRIIQLNQNEFYESKDIDVRLDKSLLTAVSYCGQYSNNEPSHAIDGETTTGFHSATYSEYGDFAIELDRPYLLDRLQMITRSSGNGRIKAYEVLYRNNKNENWKKIFEQLTEESGTNREAIFKPVLATEICIRVTNGHGKYVLIYELDLFKYNTIEERISNLFLDGNEDIIKPGVTLEEIEDLERELKTNSYRERVARAKQLFIDGLLAKEFLISLNEVTVLDRVKFKTQERVSKARIKYLDSYSVEKIIDVNCVALEDGYILSFEKIVTKTASILMYGAENIYSIATNAYDILDFCIGDDVDLKLPYEKIIDSSTTNPNNSYPINNMFDNNMDSQFHCSQYGDYCDVYFKLDKEYFIDGLRLKSYRANESGLINRFRVLLKDTNLKNTWTDLGEFVVDSYQNQWLKVEGKPYLTSEVCLRIEDSVNGWALINELEIFVHSQLGVRIDNLFSDSSFENLREGLTYGEILELEEKVTTTKEYRDKVKKAKELYLSSCVKKNYKLNYRYDFVVNELEIGYKLLLNGAVDYKLEYITTLGQKIEIDDFQITQKSDKLINLKFDRVLTKNIELTISYIDETEAWKSSYIRVLDIDQSPYYISDDLDLDYSKDLITPISHCGIYNSANGVEKMLDGDSTTMFHSKTTGKVEFVFEEPKVINEFWADISHPNEDNGKISRAKFYYKEKEGQEWIFIQNYENESPRNGVNTFTFPNILAHSFCIDVESCYAGVIIFNEVGFNIYSSLSAKIDDLFIENTMFKSLKKDITATKVEALKALVTENKTLKVKLEIASMILKNAGEFPLKVQTHKAIEHEPSHYFGLTVSNSTGNIALSNHYIQPNTDYVFVINREVQVALMTYTGKPSSNKTFILKKGINIVNIPEQGQMIFRGSRKDKIEYYSLNKENALVYRYGHTKSTDLFNKADIKNELEKDHNSNLAYVEGKTYIGAISFDWLKSNFEAKDLSKHIEIFDEYLDFIHYLDNVTGHFKQQMPYKRLLWCGRGEDTFHAGGSFVGGYTAYYGSSGPMIPKSTYDLANSWAVGHELGHELDSNDYLMGIFGEVTNNWFAEQPRQEYMKTIRCKGNVKNISDNPYSVYEMGFFDKLAFFYKMRLFYTDNSFFQKMNALMQANRASSLEEAADNFAKFSTHILKRDMSAYYIKYGIELSEEAIVWCNQYPAPAIDLQYITWENQEEFIKEEIKLFNQKYNSVSKIK
ncbi:MAG: discoidin domain-containing protein, partial [Cetobacterium sp.]